MVYEKLGIRFQYPGNWTLDEKDAFEGVNSVTVYSPGTAFWSIAVHPSAMKPLELADAALAAMRKEYDELDAEKVCETVAGHDLLGYDLNFYCLDLTNTAIVRGVRMPTGVYLIFSQAEDREFEEVEAVFKAITASLLI